VKPELQPEGLRKARPWEYVVRFLFGGVVTAATGAIAHGWGPAIGGLFLAFPAILPASLTLVEEHDGRAEAADDARGACLGSIGLAAFALLTWGAAGWPAAGVLAAATLVWLVVSTAAWAAWFGRRRRTGPARRSARRGAVAHRRPAALR